MATSGARTARRAIGTNYIKVTISPQYEQMVAIILIK